MEITEKEFGELLFAVEACVKRTKELEGSFLEWQKDFEFLKEHYSKSENSKNELFELQAEKHQKLSGHVTFIYDVMQNLCKAVFPERYVEGLKPALLVTRDPQKLV